MLLFVTLVWEINIQIWSESLPPFVSSTLTTRPCVQFTQNWWNRFLEIQIFKVLVLSSYSKMLRYGIDELLTAILKMYPHIKYGQYLVYTFGLQKTTQSSGIIIKIIFRTQNGSPRKKEHLYLYTLHNFSYRLITCVIEIKTISLLTVNTSPN